jgi:hypothetical protein
MFVHMVSNLLSDCREVNSGTMMNAKIQLVCTAMLMACAATTPASTLWTSTGPNSGVTAAAYSNTGAGRSDDNSTNNANNAKLQTIAAATLVTYPGGIGITNADACTTSGCTGDYNDGVNPEHSIDNQQRYDMALLSFTSTVKLTGVTIGWPTTSGYDTDITVMAYTGTGFTVGSKLTGLTYDQLISKGWSSVGNYSDLASNVEKTINASGIVSSYWLIGAYNPLANPGGGSVTTPTSGSSYDYIKLASVSGVVSSGDTPKVPEPGSLALFGAALLGMIGLRQRARG